MNKRKLEELFEKISLAQRELTIAQVDFLKDIGVEQYSAREGFYFEMFLTGPLFGDVNTLETYLTNPKLEEIEMKKWVCSELE